MSFSSSEDVQNCVNSLANKSITVCQTLLRMLKLALTNESVKAAANCSSSGSTGLQPLVMDRKRKTQSAAATANGVDAAAWATDLRTLQDIVGKFRDMSIDQTEFACLKGIVIFKTGIVIF